MKTRLFSKPLRWAARDIFSLAIVGGISFSISACAVKINNSVTVSGEVGPDAQVSSDGIPSKIVLSGSAAVNAGDCAQYTAGAYDSGNNSVSVSSATQVNLAGAGTGTFFSDSSCASSVTSVVIPSGSSSKVFYYKADAAQSLTFSLTDAASVLTSDSASIVVNPNAATQLVFTSIPSPISAGACVAYSVQSQDSLGNASAPSSAVTVNLSNTGAGTFYSDSGCTSSITNTSIATSTTTATFYFKDATLESPQLSAVDAASLLSSDTANITVNAGTATKLVFASGSTSITAGTCNAHVVERQDALSYAVSPATAVTVNLSNTGSGTFYSDSGCSSTITSASIASGAPNVTVYFKDTSAQTTQLSAADAGSSLTTGTLDVTVSAGSPSKLVFTSGSSSITAATCNAYVIQRQDANSNPASPASATTVNLSDTGAGVFYSDSGCSSTITSIDIASGANSVTVYFADTTAQSTTLSGAATGLTSGTSAVTVGAAAPTQLAFTTGSPSTATINTCSAVFTVESKDANGNVSAVSSSTNVNLSKSAAGNGTFYPSTDTTCAGAPVTQVTIAASASQVQFYFKDDTAESTTITASAGGGSGLSDATRGVTVSSAASPGTWSAGVVLSGTYDHTAVWAGSEMIVFAGTGGGNNGARYNPSTDTWVALPALNAPSARNQHTAVWTGTEMIVWGGGASLNTGGRYNPSSDTWTATSTVNAPAGRLRHTAVWTGTEMIVWGGYGGSVLNSGGRYDPAADTWTALSIGTNVPAARMYHSAIWTGTKMIVWGGTPLSTGVGALNSGGVYDPSNDSWSPTSTGANVPSVRDNSSAVWTGTEMIIWGGHKYDGFINNYYNSGGRYNPSSDTWVPTSTGTNVASARQTPAVWTGTEMIVWGGTSGGNMNTGSRYNPSSDTWIAMSTGANVPAVRKFHSAVWASSQLIVWGGVNGTTYYNGGGRYDLTTDQWSTITGDSVNLLRYSHTATWTGSEIVVIGGWTGSGSGLTTGMKYNPTTDNWVATPAFSSRLSHTAVWTGTEVIVWGGKSNSSSYLATGQRYNPSSGAIAATSTTNAPTSKAFHTAVWTGDEMIVWGGGTGGSSNTGGRYDPINNSWVATSTVNVPAARKDHTAVWTGTEMIVWGGATLNSGGRYDPSTDSWVPITTTNAPAARSFHSAIWTGTEMIVWGGSTSIFVSNSINSGGRYDPSTDSWTATSMGSNVPTSRSYHTAVWTGSEMIVWGGTSGSTTNTGGRYNVSSDSWVTTSTDSNVPSARQYHTATWTGSSMVVISGNATSSRYGVYTP